MDEWVIKWNEESTLEELACIKLEAMNDNSDTREKRLAEIDRIIRTISADHKKKKEWERYESIIKVASLVRQLVGDRSIRKTSEDTGVAASYIAAILKGKYLPSAEILRKLSSPDAKPRNAITLEDLMMAAGYQTDYSENMMISNGTTLDDGQSTEGEDEQALLKTKEEKTRFHRHEEYRNQQKRFMMLASGLVYEALAKKRIVFTRGFPEWTIIRADISIDVSLYFLSEWWFRFFYVDKISDVRSFRMYIRRIIGQYIFIEPKKGRKLSLVINDRECFDVFVSFKDKLSYRGELSVILINVEKCIIEKEVYLSHYDECYKKETEIYINDY